MKPPISQPRERILMGVLAAGLLLLGIPMIVRSAGRLDAGLESGEEVKPSELRRAAEQAEALDAVLADPQGSLRGGLLRLKMAMPADGPADAAELEKAVADLELGLRRAPADGQGWAALSHADLALDHPQAAAKALSAGLFVSHADPYLNPSWCVLGVALWPLLDAAERARIGEEVRWAWRERRLLIVTLAKADAHYASLLRDTLDETDKTVFDQQSQAPGTR